MLLPDTQSVRAAARLLALEAHVRAHRGDAHGAAESILAMLSAGESLRQEPIIVSQLVHIAVQGMASGTAEKLVSGAPFAEADLARLQARFQGLNNDEGMLRALMGERAMGVQAIRNPASAFGGGGPPGPVAALVAGDHAVQLYLDWMDQVIAAARQPLPGRLDQVAAVEAGIRESLGGASPITRLRSTMPALLLPALQAAMAAGARGNATAQVTAAGIAAQRFRLKHGKLPARLEDLVPGFLPAVPMDPFDGRPLRWVVKGDELVVYSIGRNRIDEGGTRPAEGAEGDVVFVLGKAGRAEESPSTKSEIRNPKEGPNTKDQNPK